MESATATMPTPKVQRTENRGERQHQVDAAGGWWGEHGYTVEALDSLEGMDVGDGERGEATQTPIGAAGQLSTTCDGRWRFRQSEGFYVMTIGDGRYALVPDNGPTVRGTAKRLGRASVQLIDDGEDDDLGVNQHVLDCKGATAVLDGSHVGDEVTLRRM